MKKLFYLFVLSFFSSCIKHVVDPYADDEIYMTQAEFERQEAQAAINAALADKDQEDIPEYGTYRSRLRRFHNPYYTGGYYDPFVQPRPAFSFGYSNYFGWNAGFSYGWGYSPWFYDPWFYDPWFSPYYNPWGFCGPRNFYWYDATPRYYHRNRVRRTNYASRTWARRTNSGNRYARGNSPSRVRNSSGTRATRSGNYRTPVRSSNGTTRTRVPKTEHRSSGTPTRSRGTNSGTVTTRVYERTPIKNSGKNPVRTSPNPKQNKTEKGSNYSKPKSGNRTRNRVRSQSRSPRSTISSPRNNRVRSSGRSAPVRTSRPSSPSRTRSSSPRRPR